MSYEKKIIIKYINVTCIQKSIVFLRQMFKTQNTANLAKIHIEMRKNVISIFPNF